VRLESSNIVAQREIKLGAGGLGGLEARIERHGVEVDPLVLDALAVRLRHV